MYDYLIVGCGLFGITFASKMKSFGKRCLIIDKRDHIGGNCYTENIEGINVHKYGPHIFHTSNKEVWDYVNSYAEFNHYVNRPKVNFKNKIYSFPINLFTLNQLWGNLSPKEMENKLQEVCIPMNGEDNLESHILSQVGEEIYETFIKGYTTKQWGKDPSLLPSSIIKRLPIRMTYDDNYFNDSYQGIPKEGYTNMLLKMMDGIEYKLGMDYFKDKDNLDNLANKVLFTGEIDQFYDYKYGKLEYRSLDFDTKYIEEIDNYQGVAVMNYTDIDVPFTRITEHKHFEFNTCKGTVITKEYPSNYTKEKVPYYPVRDLENTKIYEKYSKLSDMESKYIFGGRLAKYTYWDMHQIIPSAWALVTKEFLKESK